MRHETLARPPPTQLLLFGVFSRLRAEGMPLSVTDYLEALRALEAFPEPFLSMHGANGDDDRPASLPPVSLRHRARAQLTWFCQTLWARDADEERLIESIVRSDVPAAPAATAARLRDALDPVGSPDPATFETRPLDPPTDQKPPGGAVSRIAKQAYLPPGQADDELEWENRVSQDDILLGVELIESGGNRLPTVHHLDIPGTNRFSMQPQQLMDPLWLTAMWRRLFRPKRTEDRSRIDLQGTVGAIARTGYLSSPVYATRHTNTARLTILFDVGPHMEPWRAFRNLVRQSLEQGTSRLQQIKIGHFVGAPGRKLFEDEGIRKGVEIDKFLFDMKGAPLLVIGEAGSIGRPRLDLDRRMAAFHAATQRSDIRPVVWVNPMPAERWSPAFRNIHDAAAGFHGLPLNPDALLTAVDILRGNR